MKRVFFLLALVLLMAVPTGCQKTVDGDRVFRAARYIEAVDDLGGVAEPWFEYMVDRDDAWFRDRCGEIANSIQLIHDLKWELAADYMDAVNGEIYLDFTRIAEYLQRIVDAAEQITEDEYVSDEFWAAIRTVAAFAGQYAEGFTILVEPDEARVRPLKPLSTRDWVAKCAP